MTALKPLTDLFRESGYKLPDDFEAILQAFLQATDDHALENVKQDLGGPFGARFVVVTQDGKIHPVGKNVGNAVISSGIASRHAEHENWTQNMDAVEEMLSNLSGQKKMLLELSSGESCINCHTKQEIGFATLRAKGLLEEGDEAHVVFGATYRQTADVAKFNDLVYLLALQKIKGLDFDAGTHNTITDADAKDGVKLAAMLNHKSQDISDIPPEIAEIFRTSNRAVVVIVKDGEVFTTGTDERDEHFSRTPEVVALQNACTRKREELGIFESWNLEGATIYTSTKDLGPLMLAESYWSNALNFVSVDHDHQEEWATQELEGLSNDEFLSRVAIFVNERAGSPHTRIYSPTENRAQHGWANKDDAMNYDGAKPD